MTSFSFSYGRTYENGPFESACPVDPGCMWNPHAAAQLLCVRDGQEWDAVRYGVAIREAFEAHRAEHADSVSR